MKKIFLFLYTLLVFSGVYAQENKVKVEPVNGDKISLFSLKEVRLLDSDFKHIMDLNHAYMLSLEPDRLLSWFRREAGLTPIRHGVRCPGNDVNRFMCVPGQISLSRFSISPLF